MCLPRRAATSTFRSSASFTDSGSILRAGLNRPGIGIHCRPVPEPIGRAGSHGCIRLSNRDAATFYTLVGKSTAVTIR
ncbi:L,D-transpeptidase [Akkermansiaceae bacterium]|nr:L,D-transpeptidase [Akkermansiaceae bacterium]